MAIESACIPLPSEIIMPFSGILLPPDNLPCSASRLAGAIGNVIGSIVAYYAGVWGGRPFVERYGPYVLISIGSRHRRSLVCKIWRSRRLF